MSVRDNPTPEPVLAAERQRILRRRLVERGRIKVAEEALDFNVSDETIRRDIKLLAAEGFAEAVFGGAVLRESSGLIALGIPPVDARQSLEQAAKNAIAAEAARIVEPGQSVILDAGTTTLAVAHCLRQHRNLTIITNSLPVAQVSAAIPGAIVYVVGGKLIDRSMSLVGPQAQRDLAEFAADWAFIGAQAIDARLGFASADPYEAEVKRAMIRAARRKAIVADHTKFVARGFATFAAPKDVDLVLTSPDPPADASARFAEAGAVLRVCPFETP